MFAGDSSAWPRPLVLGRQDTQRATAAVSGVSLIGGPVHICHHNWGLLQTV